MQVRYAKDADDDIAPAVARAPSGTGEPTLKMCTQEEEQEDGEPILLSSTEVVMEANRCE